MAKPSTTGAAIPNAGFRVRTDSSNASAVKPMIGGIAVAQAAMTSSSAWPEVMVCPDRPVSGWWPMISRLATMVLAAKTVSSSRL
jgi:hypothetical protein